MGELRRCSGAAGAYFKQKQQPVPSLRNKTEAPARLRKEAPLAESQEVRRGVRRVEVRIEREVDTALRRVLNKRWGNKKMILERWY